MVAVKHFHFLNINNVLFVNPAHKLEHKKFQVLYMNSNFDARSFYFIMSMLWEFNVSQIYAMIGTELATPGRGSF